MSILLTMAVMLTLISAEAEKGHAENLDKYWTDTLEQKHVSTQVDKYQEPADAGSITAERAGYN